MRPGIQLGNDLLVGREEASHAPKLLGDVDAIDMASDDHFGHMVVPNERKVVARVKGLALLLSLFALFGRGFCRLGTQIAIPRQKDDGQCAFQDTVESFRWRNASRSHLLGCSSLNGLEVATKDGKKRSTARHIGK